MKISRLFITMSCVALASPSAYAGQPAPAAPMHENAKPMPDHSAQMHSMMQRAQEARTPAERNRLMIENMAMMKTHMSAMNGMMDMGGMMAQKPMAMPMTMDPAHMKKMRDHMAMMHQMLESLMVQQQLMMNPAR